MAIIQDNLLSSSASYELEDFVGAKFTAHMPLLMATSVLD